MQRNAPALFCVVPSIRKHRSELRLIGLIGYHTVSELALARARLRGQDMACKCMTTGNFSGSRLLEALGRTLMSLHLRHSLS